MNYSKAFKIIRASKQMNQSEFAEFIGVSKGYLSKIESGERKPTTRIVEKICGKTGVPYHLFALLSSDAKLSSPDAYESYERLKTKLTDIVLEG